MILWLGTLSAFAADWRFNGGGEFNPDSHGVLEVGYRDELIQLELLTNTLELKREILSNTGRKWGSIRGEGVMAGLLPFPWVDGRPAPELGSDASLARAEFGSIKYYQWSMYAGGFVQFGKEWFAHSPNSLHQAELNNRFVTHPQIILGRYTEHFHAYAQVGTYLLNLETESIQNHAQAHLFWRPKGVIAPSIEAHAATSENLDALHRFRIGGLNPYSIPMAGAGWGEWWSAQFATGQLGLRINWQNQQIKSSLKPFADFALFDKQSALGFGMGLNTSRKRFFLDLSWGIAPWIDRADEVGRQSLWINIGQSYSSQ